MSEGPSPLWLGYDDLDDNTQNPRQGESMPSPQLPTSVRETVISHDRWFLDRIATHILAFEGNSHVEWFEGNYQEYEGDRRRRLGAESDIPQRLKCRPEHLRSRGVELEILNDPECIQLMEEFIRNNPELWYEDIGE